MWKLHTMIVHTLVYICISFFWNKRHNWNSNVIFCHYFAVNRQLSPSPVSTPQSGESSSSSAMGTRSSSFGSPKGDPDWKICSPGKEKFHLVQN